MDAVFVVGTGRSGTHFTARLLNGFEHTRDPLNGKENSEILNDVALSAIHHRLPSEATAKYYQKHVKGVSGVFVDQHHPNLFFVRHWAAMFGNIVFLYPHRPTHQVVASMLCHEGVMGWYNYARGWRQRTINGVPYPNQFLGLCRYQEIHDLPPHILCAYRVIAHNRAFSRIVAEVNGDLRAISYEALVNDPLNELTRVFTTDEIETLGNFSLVEQPKTESLSKFRDVLSDQQVAEINALDRQLVLANITRTILY